MELDVRQSKSRKYVGCCTCFLMIRRGSEYAVLFYKKDKIVTAKDSCLLGPFCKQCSTDGTSARYLNKHWSN